MPWDIMAAQDRLAVEQVQTRSNHYTKGRFELTPNLLQSLYASQILYVASVGAAKISASLFIANVLARDSQNMFISRALTGLCTAWTVACILAISLRGDVFKPWHTHNGTQLLVSLVGNYAHSNTADQSCSTSLGLQSKSAGSSSTF